MSHRNFREFVAAAEQKGLLRRVAQSVDPSWEPGCMAKWAFQAVPAEERFGLLFDDVEGSEFSLAIGVLGASHHSYALALDVTPDEINDKWVHALLNPKPPTIVEEAPCQEIVKTGAEVKLSELPIPTWTPGKDAAPYITTITVTHNADTGHQNMGVYRTMVVDDTHVLANLSPGRHGFMQASTYLDKGKPAPIAWVIGAEPAVHFATVANLPFDEDEIAVAGGLMGAPVELVKCKTNDLLVPANAEIIIEGEVLPDEYEDEGPFGEFAGYMGPIEPKPKARITAITHRKDAIYYGLASQMPPSESTVLQSLSNAPLLLKILQRDCGETSVHDVSIDLTFGGLLAHCIVSLTPKYAGHAKKIGRLIADLSPIKRVTIVDDYVDIRDPLHMEWAMSSHYNPVRDTVIIEDVYFPMGIDPSVQIKDGKTEFGSKVVIDATRTYDAGEFSLPSKELMDNALVSWKTAGLPDFHIPKRVKLRLEQS